MLKDDLKRVIENSTPIPKMQAERIAQAIIDRLEIDKDVLIEILKNPRKDKHYHKPKFQKGWFVSELSYQNLAKAIAKDKPIKLKG